MSGKITFSGSDMPDLLHAIQVRCCHKTVDGRELSDRGTVRVAIIYRYVGQGWSTAEPVDDPYNLYGFSKKPPEVVDFGVVTCPVCGSTIELRYTQVQLALDSYLRWKQWPNQIMIHYVKKAPPVTAPDKSDVDLLKERWAVERKVLEGRKANADPFAHLFGDEKALERELAELDGLEDTPPF